MRTVFFATLALWLYAAVSGIAASPSQGFTYQGRLNEGAAPASGSYDLRVVLYTADVGGSQVGPIVTEAAMSVVNGVFTTDLDFGPGAFNGDPRWLELAVRRTGVAGFTRLDPRQAIRPAPYAQFALTPAGPKGDPGAAGTPGLAGPKGDQGDPGAAGAPGLAGLKGENGASGPAGTSGAQGPIGLTGLIGPQGPPGLAGTKGDKGDVGATGLAGSQGPQGPAGGAGGVGGSGTAGTVPLWTGSTALGDSVITQIDGNVGIGTTPFLGAKLSVNGGSNPAVICDSTSSDGVSGNSVSGRGVSGFSYSSNGVAGRSNIGTGVYGESESVGVSGSANTRGGIAVRSAGTSWFQGDTTPLPASAGKGIGIGFTGDYGYIFAFEYGSFTPKNLILNNGSGNVGIGTATPDQRLTVNGNASKPGGGSWATYSDERLKNIKGPFTSGLEAVLQLQPIRYEYKPGNALGLKSEGEYIGFRAQAVQKLIPEAVTTNDQGYLLVNNDPILWAMLNAIKEQQQQIETVQTANAALSANLETRDARIAALERSMAELKGLVRGLAQAKGGVQ